MDGAGVLELRFQRFLSGTRKHRNAVPAAFRVAYEELMSTEIDILRS